MATADFDHTMFEQGNNAGDETLLVKFFNKPKENKAKTLEEGRPIFDDVVYVDIRVAGSRNGHVCRPARQGDMQRFPRHYAAFKNREEIPLEGTPLSEWSLVTRSQVEELSFFNVKTVEQLAEMSDGNAQGFMGLNTLRQKAKDWVIKAKEAAPAIRLTEELRVRDEENAKLKAQLAELAEKVEALSTAPAETARKPRRRTKKKG